MIHKLGIPFLLLLNVGCIFAQKNESRNDTIKPNRLNEIVISNRHINDSLMNAPAAISILSQNDLTRNNNADISTPMNTVAGVFMQSGGYNTNRISIRGIGARTPYGTNKIRAFYGNIPLTSGDSETTIEDIDIENISQIEIIKGPLSSVYGAGLGGAIVLTPKLSGSLGNSLQINSSFGSYGLLKNNLSYGLNTETGSLNISYHKLESNGWRENSAYNREAITIAGELFRKKDSKLTYFLNYTFLKAFIPSSINKEMYDNNPQAAAPTWKASKGFERYDSYLAGFAYDSKFLENLSNSTSVFFNHKESDEPRPFDILIQNTTGYGARTQFTGNFDSKNKLNFLFGAEYFRDGFKGQNLENLYLQNNNQGSLAGNLISKSEQNRSFYNLFAQIRILLSKKFEVQTGINVNKTRFDTFPNPNSESYEYDAIWSPQLSILYKSSGFYTLYASASRGFSLPSVEETLTANGTVNSDIKPESGYNFEIGQKAWFLNKKLYTEINIYRMQIRDLLVAQRIGDDQYIGVNAGETIHQGIEVSADYTTRISSYFSLNAFASASVGDYEFKDFYNNGIDYSGNNLTGVPANKANAGITFKTNSGIYLSADYQFVDSIPMNDSNTLHSDSYQLLNLKTGWHFRIVNNLSTHLAAGINNATDEHYASMILVNATSPPNVAPRYYYPGLPVNYYGNISLKYSF